MTTIAITFHPSAAADRLLSSHPIAKPSIGTNLAFSSELLNSEPIRAAQVDPKTDPFVQFESVFLRNFIEAMLPPEDAGAFGTGSAGEYWRSIMADQMSEAIAVNGKTGIAAALRESIEKF